MIILWIILLVLVRSSTKTILLEEKKIPSEVTDCVSGVVFLLGRIKINLQYTSDHEELGLEILKKLKIPYVVNTKETRITEGVESRISDDLIIILGGVKPEQVLRETLWNENTRFLIVINNKSDITNHFRNFWKFKVINVFALVRESNGVSVYSFLPYRGTNCEVELIKVDECINGELKKKGTEMRDQYRLKNMNGCPLNVTITEVHPNIMYDKKNSEVRGFETKLMKAVAKKYNFTSIFRLPLDGIGWGWIHPTPKGSIGELFTGKSDFSIGMLAPLLERYENLDVSKNYNMDECVTFGVPQGSGPKHPAWIATFILEFTISTWLLIVFSFVLITINMWLINKYSNVNWLGGKTELVIFVISSCLGAPIKIPRCVSAKVSIAYWIIFCFIITVAYKASMGSKLAIPPRDADIDTFTELLNSDLELTGYKNMLQLLVHNDWTIQSMRKRYHSTNYTSEYVVDQIANRAKIADLRHSSTFYYYSLINPKARGKIHMLRECVLNYQPHVVLKKFSPFTRKVNQVITRLEESGIMVEWRAEYIYKVPPPTKPFLKLSLDHIFAVICILLIGLFISFLIFLFEKFSYYRNNNKPKKIFIPVTKYPPENFSRYTYTKKIPIWKHTENTKNKMK